MCIILMQNECRSFCKKLGQSPSTNYAMSRKGRGLKMGIGKARRIFAPTLFVFNLPVALARAPGKISNQAEAVAHGWCKPDTKWQIQRPKEVLQMSSSCRIPYRCANRLLKKGAILTTLSHNLNWNYWCRDDVSCYST
jgi:hypothetical protein